MSRQYPSRPVVGVGAIILESDRVLVVRRGREPLKGIWSIPGGALEAGESLAEGLEREIREEVGLEIRILDLVEVFERIIRDEQDRVKYHYVLIDYLCETSGGALHPADDVDRAEWVEREKLSQYELTEGTPGVIEKAFQIRDRLSFVS